MDLKNLMGVDFIKTPFISSILYLNIKKDNRTATDATIASQKKYTNSLLHGRWSYHYYIRQVVQQKIQ